MYEGRLQLTQQLLANALGLPDEVHVYGTALDPQTGNITFNVIGDKDFGELLKPSSSDGKAIPFIDGDLYNYYYLKHIIKEYFVIKELASKSRLADNLIKEANDMLRIKTKEGKELFTINDNGETLVEGKVVEDEEMTLKEVLGESKKKKVQEKKDGEEHNED